MLNEEKKFLVDVYKICGFALMAPFGQYFLIPFELNTTNLSILALGHLILSIILFCLGVIMIQRAYEMVQKE